MTPLRFIFVFIGLFAVSPLSFAQALPSPSPTNFISEIQGTLSNTFSRLGFAANDPRVVSTLSEVKTSLTAASKSSPLSSFLDLASGGLAADGLPAVGLLGDLGSLANPLLFVATASPLVLSASKSTANWLYDIFASPQTVTGASAPLPLGTVALTDVPVHFRPPSAPTTAASVPTSSQTITVSPATASAPAKTITVTYPSPALDPNALYYSTSGSPAADVTIFRFTVTLGGLPTGYYPIGTDLQQVLAAAQVVDPSLTITSASYFDPSTIQVQTSDGQWTISVSKGSIAAMPSVTEVLSQTSSQTFWKLCNPGFVSESGSCVAAPSITNPIPITISESMLPQILPADVMTTAISPQLVASLANQAWQQVAGQTANQVVPYSLSSPATAADAQTAIQAATSPATLTDLLVAPQTSSSTITSPSTGTTPTTTTTTPATVSSAALLGPNPGISAPALSAPSGPSILAPITSLLPSFFGYSLNIPAGTCPAPTLHLFGNQYVFDAQCVLFAKYGPLLRTALVAAYTLAALFLVLSA